MNQSGIHILKILLQKQLSDITEAPAILIYALA